MAFYLFTKGEEKASSKKEHKLCDLNSKPYPEKSNFKNALGRSSERRQVLALEKL